MTLMIGSQKGHGGLVERSDVGLRLFSGIELAGSAERIDKEPRWADLQRSVRVVWTPNGDPVRQIAPRSRLPVGRYNSRKAGRMLPHQSRGHGPVGGEKLALMRCEVDPAVIDFRSQHIRFDLLAGGTRSYFPDIVTLLHDGTVLVVEVKKNARWRSDPDYRDKIDTVRDVCADLGWAFEVWTDADIAPTARVRDNIVQVQMQRFIGIDDVQVLLVIRAMQANRGRLTIGQIKQVLGGMPGAGDLVRGLMCRGVLQLPLAENIGDATVATLVTPAISPILEHAF